MKYELTITLRPQMYRFDAREQYVRTSVWLKQILYPYKVSIVAELTQVNNIHYHGIIDLKDLRHRDKFLNRFRGSLVFGKMTCTQLIDEPKWIEYMKKNIHITWDILNIYPVLLDEFNCVEIPKEVEEFTKNSKYDVKLL